MANETHARIRIYEMIDGDSLSSVLDFPLSHFGACPNVGDTLCFDMPTTKFYSVSRRYYVRMKGWAIVVREVPASPQTDSIMRAWQDDDDWDAKIDAEEAMEDERELMAVRDEIKLLLGKPPEEIALNQWEEPAMKKLATRGVGKPLPCRGIAGLGKATINSLQRRGFVSILPSDTAKTGDERISLTPEGAKAWKELKAFRKKVEAARAGRGPIDS
ncbi:hypothetical protein [Agrobacterium radiobacter]|uniref:hypothetical protein n=1 Tax=Agrobacterium radiobacter TaxID=362 RepID=UPI0016056B1A|nr:hypothetical protein [Agrobacterium radiobacter]MBB4407117.1 hypothetical protein [Agrobacterium radiobacter]MBB4452679.1 hypothetical protein [Agrobacterium radiobacter]